MLTYLSKYYGKTILKVRPHLYTIFSHSKVNDKQYCSILAHCYRRHAAFANLIDEQYYFGDETIPLQQRITDKLMSLADEARQHFGKYDGKYLMENEGYLYYAFNEGCAPNDLLHEEGVMTYV